MSEKKELNKEQLEKVTGGYSHPSEIVWIFSKDALVQVKNGNILVDGKVAQRGFKANFGYFAIDYYFIESVIDQSINGWYISTSFEGNITNINNKNLDGTGNPQVVAW